MFDVRWAATLFLTIWNRFLVLLYEGATSSFFSKNPSYSLIKMKARLYYSLKAICAGI
jgi:hypothetical protein